MDVKKLSKTAIYFDLDGTLTTYDKNFKEILEEGVSFEVNQEIFQFWSSEVINNLEEMAGKPYLEALKSLKKEFNLDFDVAESRVSYIEAEIEATIKKEQIIQIFKELSEENKVGILTNGCGEVQMKKIKKHGLYRIADEIIVSNQEGVRKPDPGIFKLAKKKLKADKHIYIGDSYEEDIKPARENGLEAIHTENKNKHEIIRKIKRKQNEDKKSRNRGRAENC